MRIAVVSDTHLGFNQKERENEAFNQCLEAVKLALTLKPDVILMPGDLFNKDEPVQKTFIQAFQLFSYFKCSEKSSVKIEKIMRDNKTINYSFDGLPVIAINGTHEYRGKDFTNAVKVLEAAGFLMHLHAEKAVIEKDNEKIVIHGLSGVPEKVALNVLKAWNPKPELNAFNILMLHQSFKEFLPFDNEMTASISLSDIPEGFDLILDGHFHKNYELKEFGRHLIIPGSTIITQMKKLEAEKPKGILLIEVQGKEKKITFHALLEQRKFYFIELSFDEAEPDEVVSRIKEKLNLLELKGKPLVRIKLKGSLVKGFKKTDLNLNELIKEFQEKTIISISNNLNDISFKKKMLYLSEIQNKKKSVKDLGFELLEKNLNETNFKNSFSIRQLFELLEKNNSDKALKVLTETN